MNKEGASGTPGALFERKKMRIVIEKATRRLTVESDRGETLFTCSIALGSCPMGPKEREGDGRTPEGVYFVCLKKRGKYGPSLGISYLNEADALRCGAAGELVSCIRERAAQKQRPPWGTALGGEIYIHGGGAERDWTAGCVALNDADAEALYALVPLGTEIMIHK